MSRLYIISTPIGNLGDMTYRAVEVLGTVDRILAEDTRRTAILLDHYGLKRSLVSAHAHNEAARAALLLSWLDAGESVALVSDAGTPLVSDPGWRLVVAATGAGHEVVPIPGASAVLAALVGSGLEPEPFTFHGFAPRSGQPRRALLQAVAASPHTVVLYEAPSRLARLLRDLRDACGSERRAVVARELTKVHETFARGTLSELVAYYAGERVRGEVVVVVAGGGDRADQAGTERLARALAEELSGAGRRPSEIARELSRRLDLARNRAYEIALAVTGSGEGERHQCRESRSGPQHDEPGG